MGIPVPSHPPLIRTDTSNMFAHHTMRVRVPGIIRSISATNPDYPAPVHAALDRLAESLETDQPIPMLDLPAPDYDDWARAYAGYAGATWLNTDWFFAEIYCYRLLIQIVRWWETGRDPFWPQKNAELESDALRQLLARALSPDPTPEEHLSRLLHHALWGNRIDLSLKTAVHLGGESVHSDDLLVDDTEMAVNHILTTPGVLHVVADNVGTELALDCCLIDALLQLPGIETVMLHVKMHPTFVSDATQPDALYFLRQLASGHYGPDARALGNRLRAAFDSARLHIIPDAYWNSTRMLWDLPPRLQTLFGQAALVILKGDANYRRLTSDATWPPYTPFNEVVRYFPAPLLTLRTLKSDVIVGLTEEQVKSLDNINSDWRHDGRHGVVQGAF